MIYLRLKQMHENVYYWQELHKGEIDFVGVNGNDITPYQITLNELEPRHQKSLQCFYEHFPTAHEPVIISLANAEEYL